MVKFTFSIFFFLHNKLIDPLLPPRYAVKFHFFSLFFFGYSTLFYWRQSQQKSKQQFSVTTVFLPLQHQLKFTVQRQRERGKKIDEGKMVILLLFFYKIRGLLLIVYIFIDRRQTRSTFPSYRYIFFVCIIIVASTIHDSEELREKNSPFEKKKIFSRLFYACSNVSRCTKEEEKSADGW